MENKNKFEVSIDTEKHLLYADVTVCAQPEWKGVIYYSLVEVLEELNKQGYNLKQRDCIKPNKYVLRSDSGNSDVFVGRWIFKLSSPVQKSVPKEKPVTKEKSTVKETPTLKNTTTKKKPISTKTGKQTTKEILEEYRKGNN